MIARVSAAIGLERARARSSSFATQTCFVTCDEGEAARERERERFEAAALICTHSARREYDYIVIMITVDFVVGASCAY